MKLLTGKDRFIRLYKLLNNRYYTSGQAPNPNACGIVPQQAAGYYTLLLAASSQPLQASCSSLPITLTRGGFNFRIRYCYGRYFRVVFSRALYRNGKGMFLSRGDSPVCFTFSLARRRARRGGTRTTPPASVPNLHGKRNVVIIQKRRIFDDNLRGC